MLTRKLIARLLVVLMLASLVLSGSVPLLAQGPVSGVEQKIKDKYKEKADKDKQKKE